ADNGDTIPTDGMGGNLQYMPTSSPPPTGTPDDTNAWFNLYPPNVAERTLQQYYNDPGGNTRAKLPFPGGKGKIWHCAAASMTDSDFQQLMYGGAGGFFSFAFNIDLKKGSTYPRMPKLSNLKKPTATVLMFDVVFNPVTEKVNSSPQYNSVNPANRYRSIGTRHDKGTVIAFTDGHSRYF